MSKDTYYFSHDYNARTDEKIKLLIRKHGLKGYGIFWAIIEDLYNNANALRLDCEGIAFELREDIETIKSVIQDFDLFQIKDNYFGSLSVQDRLNKRLGKSAKARESAFLRWNKSEGNANAMQTHSEGNAIKESKVKEKKEKESKVKETSYRDNIVLSENENEKLISEYGQDFVNACYDLLSSYKIEKSYTTKSDYLTIKRWVVDAVMEKGKVKPNIIKLNTDNKLNAELEEYKKRQSELGQSL